MRTRLAKEIQSFFSGEVETSSAVREEYSRDASLFRIKPEIVVFPRNADDVSRLAAFVAKKKQEGVDISLTARSAGTDMTGGPLTNSILMVCTRHMNRVKGFVGDYITVEPGMYYRDLDVVTRKQGLFLPSYTASRDICAVGGMVANNAGGEKNIQYGKTERYIKRITMVLRDGRPHVFTALHQKELQKKLQEDGIEGDIYRRMYELVTKNKEALERARPAVSKNSSGYYLWNVVNGKEGTFDLTKILVGSQGTLGIITDVTFQLMRPKPYSSLVVMFLKDTKRLGEVINHVMRHKPESFESYDNHTFRIAVKFFPEFAARLKSNFIKLAWSFLPELWMVITGGVPKLVLLAEFTGETKQEAIVKAEKTEKDLRATFGLKTKIARTHESAQKYWTMRRESFNLLRKRVRGLRTAPFIDDFVVLPNYLPEFLPKLDAILDTYKNMIYTVAGHMGDGNFHIIPLMDPKDPTLKKTIQEVAQKVYELVLQYHGSISGEHNDGLVRGPYVSSMFGREVYRLFEETKRIFDPDDIFNPGKKIGVLWEQILPYLDTKSSQGK